MSTLTADYSDKASVTNKFGVVLRKLLSAFSARQQLSRQQQDVSEVSRLARSFEESQPSLAAELRFIASRG